MSGPVQEKGVAGNRSVAAPNWLLRCFEAITAILLVMIVQFLRGKLPVIPIAGMKTGADDL